MRYQCASRSANASTILAEVVVQERLPCLPGWSPESAEDPRDRPLGDVDTEHLQLSMEPWRSPQGIVGDHLRYQPTNRERGRRSPTGVAFRPGQACPEQRKCSRSQRTTLSA